MATRRKLIGEIKAGLRAHADPSLGAQKQAYLKSEMPCLGVTAPQLRTLLRSLIAKYRFESGADLEDTVLALWRKAEYREERHAAIELCEHKAHDSLQTIELLSMYEEMITSGAWWDYIDPLAGHRLRRLLELYPSVMKNQMLQWSDCDDMWKRRSSILCQLRRKQNTDLDLLYRTIEPNLESREFFLRKAIGWALRDYAWTDPDEIERYAEANEERLSGLSKREALKNVDRIRARRLQRRTE